MLLFRSEDAIDAWCALHGEPRGAAVPLEQVWLLAREWYGSRMDPAFRGLTPELVRGIFQTAGLTTPFWHV